MGMLIDGVWQADVDRFMVDGVFQREASPLPSTIEKGDLERLASDPARFVLIASNSCPWSHGAILAWALKGFSDTLPLQMAGGARVEGYGLLSGVLADPKGWRHLHQAYALHDPRYTGRATVPVLWDVVDERIVSNDSGAIMKAFDVVGSGGVLYPTDSAGEIDGLTQEIFDGLSNAVYRAGLAQTQVGYDHAIDSVFGTLDWLEARLVGQKYLFGTAMTLADVRLFATLVRFDTVYATHFRCTRKRLVDYPSLWRFARQVFQMPRVKQTVDFEEIRAGYYLNDGSHNPHGLIGAQPVIDWESTIGL